MDGEGERRVRSRTEEADRLTSLPDSLLFQILSNLRTKDAVKTSVLSTRWRSVWRFVPKFELDSRDFGRDYNALVSFNDKFLGFNTGSYLQKFSLVYDWNDRDDPDNDNFKRWINMAVDRRVQCLHLVCRTNWALKQVQTPSTVYTCESLVSLVLCNVALPDPILSVTLLPCLKSIKLSVVSFGNDSTFERLISGCPILESLALGPINAKVLSVYSQSLLRFTICGSSCVDVAVAVDAPRLEYLQIRRYQATESFIVNNLGSLATVDLDIEFKNPNELSKRNMIRDFLIHISTAKKMFISEKTLAAFYKYLRWQQPRPLFHNLSYMYATVFEWTKLLILLATCPNLKSLVLRDDGNEGDEISYVGRPGCFLTSLEYVEVKRPTTWNTSAMRRVIYFLENASLLKKLTLRLSTNHPTKRQEDSVILNQLCAVPRLSSSCQIEIISVPIRTFLQR